MKHILTPLLIFTLLGCAQQQSNLAGSQIDKSQSECPGNTQLPPEYKGKFTAIEDPELLQRSLGEPGKGKLCQGQVYQAKSDVNIIVYRAWNSTNPNSEYGSWWATRQPAGNVAQYRYDYEICYQWSPLDKLTHCKLREGAKIVIGTGQSAECSQYLSYPASATQQVYLEAAKSWVSDCVGFDGLFQWAPEVQQ